MPEHRETSESPRTLGAMKTSSVFLLVLLVITPPLAAQKAEDQIRSLRAQSNAAIARHDVEGVVSLFDAEYQVTAGSGVLYHDRAADPERWAETFARADDLVFVRTPESVEASSAGDRAAEVGVWSGSWSTADGVRSTGGRYAAHWVLTNGQWKLRSELFVALRCEGAGCS